LSFSLKNIQPPNVALLNFLSSIIFNKFDTFFAVPQERYGFSNNAPVFFGPPSFEEASFFVKDEEMIKIEISLR